MPLSDCIKKLVTSKLLTKATAEKVQGEATRLRNSYIASGKYSPEEAAIRAEEDAIRFHQRNTEAELNRIATDFQKYERLRTIITKSDNPEESLRDILRSSPVRRAKTLDVENHALDLWGLSTTNLADFIEQYRSKVGGNVDRLWRVQSNRELQDIVRARFGDTDVAPELRRFADEYGKSVDFLLDRLAKSGVPVKRLEGWGLPQHWDVISLINRGKDEFVKDLSPMIDRSRTLNTNGTRMTDDELTEFLREAYDTLVTNGLTKKDVGMNVGKGTRSISGRFARHRSIHMKDGQAWSAVNQKYGHPDIFEVMLSYLKTLANDVSMAEILGSNPLRTFQALQADVALRGKDLGINPTARTDKRAENIFLVLSGVSGDISDPTIAGLFSSLRNINVAARLGSATISAIADQATIKARADLWGLSYFKVLGESLAQLNPLTAAERRREATRLGIVADWALHRLAGVGRFSDIDTVGKASRITGAFADFTIRASGLAALTRATRSAYALELNSFLAKLTTKSYESLDTSIQQGLRLRGITAEDWEELSKSLTEVRGVKFIDPSIMENDKLASKFLSLILSESRLAVLEPDAEVRALMFGSGKRGELGRELRQSLFQFKSFPIALLMNQVRTTLFDPRLTGPLNRFTFAAKITMLSMLFGAASVQLGQLAQGKEPIDVDSPKLYTAAFTKGAALGFISEYITSEKRTKEQLASQALGPVGDLAFGAVAGVTKIASAAKGDEVNFGGLTVDALDRVMPGKLFYTRLAMDRYIVDQLRLAIDPKANERFRRLEKTLKKRTGQKYYWSPGELAPQK